MHCCMLFTAACISRRRCPLNLSPLMSALVWFWFGLTLVGCTVGKLDIVQHTMTGLRPLAARCVDALYNTIKPVKESWAMWRDCRLLAYTVPHNSGQLLQWGTHDWLIVNINQLAVGHLVYTTPQTAMYTSKRGLYCFLLLIYTLCVPVVMPSPSLAWSFLAWWLWLLLYIFLLALYLQ